MAGSNRTFGYTSDAGNVYLITADESNTEAVNGATSVASAAALAAQIGVPRNIKPRVARYSNATRTRTLRIVVVTQAIFNALPATIPDPLEAGTLTLRGSTGERRRIYAVSDTGLTDGDAPT
jgi:hypothetical protein